MTLSLPSLITSDARVRQLVASTQQLAAGQSLSVAGVAGSLASILMEVVHTEVGRQILIVARDEASAERIRDDICLVSGPQGALFFRGDEDHHRLNAGTAKSVEDIESLRLLLSHEAGIVVTHPPALTLSLAHPSALRERAFTVNVGTWTGFSRCIGLLVELGFEKKDFVETYGDYAVRGGILDVFPYVGEHPVRLEFFGDSIESIREFDPLSQRSIKELSTAFIVPDLLTVTADPPAASASLFDFLQPDAFVVLQEPGLVQAAVEKEIFLGGDRRRPWKEIKELLDFFPQLHIVNLSRSPGQGIDVQSLPQPSFNGSVQFLRKNLVDLQQKSFAITISCDTQSELVRLKELLSDMTPGEQEDHVLSEGETSTGALDVARLEFSLHTLHEGFILPGSKVALYTEHQIFNRLKRRGRQLKQKFRGMSRKELQQLHKGDYVVHTDYGIGIFEGMKKIRVRNVEQEVLKLSYEANDTLYVNLNYVNKIQKYSSKEGHIPKLSRLGSGDWERLKSRVKKRIKDIARDLIQLYARRKDAEGFAFQPDSLWQKELEASFMYEDTYDQARATREVKQDMEAPHPMDRLVCGDVGFGKTEVAVRAAFKAVLSGKQVAILVPTTILALQHRNTFVDRLARYSTNIQTLTRFKSKKEQAEIIGQLKAGTIDIVIGTHRLLSKDVGFKDLGLLVIDEEHRFGVSAKEKLRQLKAAVDTLALTATPIPRTLHFSLMGARDLSVIATPPKNRLPVITEIGQYSADLITEAVRRELRREGQVYFVHDRIQNIVEVTGQLQALLPEVRMRFAHGQMQAHELERVMLDYLEKKIDLLVCTKIIESGLDLPNVNTIIVNRADRFGMAELYQLRGRVGRSNQQAYAYLLVPPLSVLPGSAVRRLQAVEEFTELGSGFNLAMRDLEIRGAGNLLGAEQSGFIETMGFEAYTRILEEAVSEIKDQEFQGLFERHEEGSWRANDVVVDVDEDALIPDTYAQNDAERLELYRRLYAVDTPEQLREIAEELEDRFGKHPKEARNLLQVVEIRLAAADIGAQKVVIRERNMDVDFPPESDRRFYEGSLFQELMEQIGAMNDKRVSLRQQEGVLKLKVTLEGGNNDTLHSSLEFVNKLRVSKVRHAVERPAPTLSETGTPG
jgi:transcription-repair coupling factor (superfamily II helicase)